MKSHLFKKHTKIVLVTLLLLALVSIFIYSGITGYSVSFKAGEVTETNVSVSTGHWQALYGEIFEDSQSTTPYFMAIGGETDEFNITLPCIGDEVYASINSTIDLQEVAKGEVQSVDNYLQLSPTHLESGSKVLSQTSSFLVLSSNITNVPTTYMKVYNSPNDTTFSLGLLNESNNLVFVSYVPFDTIGFDNKKHDYQMMVPVNQSNATYYFFSDCTVSFCGDNICDSDESCSSCPQDCGFCPTLTGKARTLPFCGDGICQKIENCSTCPLDCGFCPEKIPILEQKIMIEGEKGIQKITFYLRLKDYSQILKEILFTVRGILVLLLIIIIFLSAIILNKYRKKKK